MTELFDHHAKTYESDVTDAIGILGTEIDALAGEKARLLLSVMNTDCRPPSELSFLDVGCGIGSIERELSPLVGAVTGVDVSHASLDRARIVAPRAAYAQYNGEQLPFPECTFDAAFTSCVLHHVPPVERDRFVSEMVRVVKPGGAIGVIEHNPFNPVTRWIVSRCAFDADAVLLTRRETAGLFEHAGARVAGWRYIGFWPRRSAWIESMEQHFSRLPAGAQYCLWATKPAA